MLNFLDHVLPGFFYMVFMFPPTPIWSHSQSTTQQQFRSRASPFGLDTFSPGNLADTRLVNTHCEFAHQACEQSLTNSTCRLPEEEVCSHADVLGKFNTSHLYFLLHSSCSRSVAHRVTIVSDSGFSLVLPNSCLCRLLITNQQISQPTEMMRVLFCQLCMYVFLSRFSAFFDAFREGPGYTPLFVDTFLLHGFPFASMFCPIPFHDGEYTVTDFAFDVVTFLRRWVRGRASWP